jgi:dihydroorotase
MKYLIKDARVIDPKNNLDAVLDVLIENDKIAKVETNIKAEDAEIIDAKGLACVPAFIDLHAHLREPGFEGKETILSGTRAAARGGFATVCMMANTNPPMDCAQNVKIARDSIDKDALVNVKITATITKGRKGEELADFAELKKAGAVALSDDGSCVGDADLMKRALQKAYDLKMPVSSHAENSKLFNNGVMNDGFISCKLGLSGISNESEYKAVEAEINLVKETKTALHFQHISTKESCELIAQAKKAGLKITAESTPHHFTLTETECESFSGNAKMNPPLRSAQDVKVVKQAIKDGVIDAIATDHAPHAPHEKEIEFDKALFGIIGFETAFPLAYQTLVESGLIDLKKLIELMSVNPARIYGIEGGSLSQGAKADIALIDLNKKWTYSADEILSSSRNSPYIGRELKGFIEHLFVGGKLTLKNGVVL